MGMIDCSKLKFCLLGWAVLASVLFGGSLWLSFDLAASSSASTAGPAKVESSTPGLGPVEAAAHSMVQPAQRQTGRPATVRTVRVAVVNGTGHKSDVGFAGYDGSWTSVERSGSLELNSTAGSLTLKLQTVAGGSCFVFVTTSGTLTASGNPLDPDCGFAPAVD